MNEEELKRIWQTADRAEPMIDYDGLQASLRRWRDKLRRKAKIEIWMQIATVVLNFVPAFFYPKWIVFALGVAALGVWYIPELRKIYKPETIKSDEDARQSLNTAISTMKRYFRRTRIVLYVFSPLLVPAAFYGLGYFEYPSISLTIWVLWIIFITLICEAAIITFNEIYFAIVYKPALNELNALLQDLESDH